MIEIEHLKQLDLNIPQHEVLNLRHSHSGLVVECEQGVVWVTSAGDIHDYTLEAGDCFIAQDANPLVIEAMQDAVINLKDTKKDFAIHVIT